MSSVEKLENEVASLPQQQLAEFRAWFERFDADAWDKQFEQDAKSGKLDAIAERAITDFKEGRFHQL